MGERIYHDTKAERTSDEIQEHPAKEVGATAVKGVDDAELDTVMKEIDELLETSPAEFVQQFQQKGGE